MSQIEEALYRSKTKLNAALARSRIKSRVLSIDWLLPDSVRKNDKIGCRMHVTCWVNFVKTRSVKRSTRAPTAGNLEGTSSGVHGSFSAHTFLPPSPHSSY